MKMNPTNEYFEKGNKLLAKGEIDKAIDEYIKSIQEFPDFGNAYLTLRNLKLNGRQVDKLIPVYKEALESTNTPVRVNINLADLYTRKGLLKEAICYYRKVLYIKNEKQKPEFIKKYWNENMAGKPDFIIIGAEKSGTSSLFQYMINHPKILTPVEKETHFFTEKFGKGRDWYQSQFAYIPAGSGYITGEASTSYLCDYNNASERIRQIYPRVKFVAVLRNPIDRAVSNYYQMVKFGDEKRSIDQAMNEEMRILKNVKNPMSKIIIYRSHAFGQRGYIWRSLYYYFVIKWMRLFPKENFYIIESSELFENTKDVMNDLFKFFELEEYSETKYEKYNPGSYDPIQPELRETMYDFFKTHNDKLFVLLKKDFNWT